MAMLMLLIVFSLARFFIKEGELPLQIAAQRRQYPPKKIIFSLKCETNKNKSSAKNLRDSQMMAILLRSS